jgi:hypothetical protein
MDGPTDGGMRNDFDEVDGCSEHYCYGVNTSRANGGWPGADSDVADSQHPKVAVYTDLSLAKTLTMESTQLSIVASGPLRYHPGMHRYTGT